MIATGYTIQPIGVIRSELTNREAAPHQGCDRAPDAWLDVHSTVAEGLDGLAVGNEIIVITWFHQASRDRLKVHPRGDPNLPLTGALRPVRPIAPIRWVCTA